MQDTADQQCVSPDIALCAVQHMLDHMLTIHVRSRVFPTMEDAAQFVKAIVTLYDVYSESKVQHQLQVSYAARAQQQ